jgi:hypothetical protein
MPPAYGQQPMPQQGIQPYAPPGAMMGPPGAGTLSSAGNVAGGPTRRNALMTLLVPMAGFVGGVLISIVFTVLAVATGAAALALVGSLLCLVLVLGGAVIGLLNLIKMVGEVKSVTRNDAFAWWPILVPIYNIIWSLTILPPEVTRAKQMLGVQAPTRAAVLYFFLLPWALASDLNDMAR